MKKPLKKKIMNQKGFTLLEAMIGSVILTFGILSVYALLLSAVRNNTQAMAVTEAATIAADKLEYLNALPGWADSTHTDLSEGEHDPENAGDGYTVTWDVEDIDTNNKKITVTVTDGRLGHFGSRREIQLVSIKGRDL